MERGLTNFLVSSPPNASEREELTAFRQAKNLWATALGRKSNGEASLVEQESSLRYRCFRG